MCVQICALCECVTVSIRKSVCVCTEFHLSAWDTEAEIRQVPALGLEEDPCPEDAPLLGLVSEGPGVSCQPLRSLQAAAVRAGEMGSGQLGFRKGSVTLDGPL